VSGEPHLPSPLVRSLLDRCRFPVAGTPLRCAVSGGADSLALLVLAAATAHARGDEVEAVHVDHGLRVGSAADADVVAAAAERHGARFRCVSVALESGPNLEARARDARRAVLPAGVLTGHTADDQAETVLLNLVRGSGLDGLAAMGPEGHPLLGVRRAETHALCEAEGLVPVVDPSNDDPAFRRNRMRHEVLPLLAEVAERDLTPVLARQADLLRDDAMLLEALAEGVDAADARLLAAAPVPLARRAVRAWLRTETGAAHPPDSATVARVLAVARGEAVGTDVGVGWSVRRSAGRLRVVGPVGAAGDR